jgi:hypothetical protein
MRGLKRVRRKEGISGRGGGEGKDGRRGRN